MADPVVDKEASKSLTIVELAKSRFEKWLEANKDARQQSVEDTKFALGDSENGWQWPDDVAKGRKSDQRVILTVNITAQHCNQIINNIRQNRPALKVSPVDSNSDKKTAELLAGLIRNIQAQSAADGAHDTAAEHAIYGGEGYWRVLTEYESPKSHNQIIKIKPITNPQLVAIDHNAKELDKSDATWGIIFEDLPKAEIKAEYGIDAGSWESSADDWVKDDMVRVAEYYYRETIKDKALLLSDGTELFETELAGKPLQPGIKILKSRPTERYQWKWCKLVGKEEKPVEETDLLGSYLPIISVIGKEVNVDGEIVRKGVVRDLKDPARIVNYAYSETVQTIALQNKVPYLAAAESVEGHEDEWKNANTSNEAMLVWNAYDENGQALPKPERQQASVLPTAQINLLQLSTEQMRAASGQQNSNFGIRSEASSGIGIQRLKQQGDVATFHFPDNLARALRYEGVVLIDLIQKYYDTPRVVRILGLDGKPEHARLDPGAAQAYAEQMNQTIGEVEKIFNPTVGTYDVAIDTGPSYQTQRQEAADHLNELAAKNPALMQIAGDIIMRAQDFPMSEELAERLEKTLPPNLRDEPGVEAIPPAAQAQMQQMGQQLEQLQQALQQATQELDEAKRGVAQDLATIESKKQVQLADAQVRKMLGEMDAETKIGLAEIEARVALRKAKIDSATRKEIAEMEIAAQADIEEMKGYFALKAKQKAGEQAIESQVIGVALKPEEPEETEEEEEAQEPAEED